MADETPVIPASDAWDRVGNVVRTVEAWRNRRIGRTRRPSSPDLFLWAKITGKEAFSGGGSGGYKYAWSEAERTDNGFTLGGLGRSGLTSDDTYAVRLAEANNERSPLPNDVYVLMRLSGDGDGVIRATILENPSGLFPVNVTQTGGSAGNRTTACTFTYTVESLDGISLGTSKSVVWARPEGKMTAGTHGLAYYDASAGLILYQVDEVAGTVGC